MKKYLEEAEALSLVKSFNKFIKDDFYVNKFANYINDGSHTFQELYKHRKVLFSIICNSYPDISWKSKLHDDGTMFDGYFIVGINAPEGQFTYHYELQYWDDFKVKELEKAPEWDGHTSDDIYRLESILKK